MDHFLYVAASGAKEAMLAQAVNANNLANTSTTGFRADLALAKSAYLQGEGLDTHVFPSTADRGANFTEGVINSTGRDLDVAVNGPGWIAVQAPDGREAYSRRGDLRVTDLGQLINGAGQSIIGSSGPVALPPHSNLVIGSDGTISIVPLGESPNSVQDIDQIKLVNPDTADMSKGADGLMEMHDGEAPAVDPAVRLISGSLESSNVNTVASMVQMIELARQFEMHTKIMAEAEQLDRSSAQLMSMT